MPAFESVDITSEAFAMRLANLLVATRATTGLSVAAMARASRGRFSRHDLKEFERGSRTLDEATIDELAQLYRCDLGAILPLRLPVEVAPGQVSAGGVVQPVEGTGPDATLTAYLLLVRSLRRQHKAPTVDLRRDDVEVLAGFLAVPPETVVHRLATLMTATQAKRTAMLAVLATGAVVIGLAGTAVAIGASDTAAPPSPISPDATVVETTVADTVADTTTTTTSVPAETVATVAPTTSTVVSTTPVTTPVTTAPVPATTARPPAVVPTAPPPAPTTTVPLVDTDLTTTTTIVSTGEGPPLPPPAP